MKEEKTTPLRERMIEDMRIRGLSPKTRQAHIRAVRYFAEFIGRSPDTATPDKRTPKLSVTPDGRDVLVRCCEERTQLLMTLMGGLSEEECSKLECGLRKLSADIGA